MVLLLVQQEIAQAKCDLVCSWILSHPTIHPPLLPLLHRTQLCTRYNSGNLPDRERAKDTHQPTHSPKHTLSKRGEIYVLPPSLPFSPSPAWSELEIQAVGVVERRLKIRQRKRRTTSLRRLESVAFGRGREKTIPPGRPDGVCHFSHCWLKMATDESCGPKLCS